jgi:hypothetical protein
MPFDTSGMTAGTWQLTTMTKTITNSGNLTLGFYGTTGNAVNVWVDLVSNVSRTSADVQTLLTNTINKVTPTATLAVNNSPVTYDGTPKAATVGVTSSSVPGSAQNISTGGAATQTDAATYGVTANFVPTDTTNYNTLTGLSAGNFTIQKATPTATLAVNNSPVTYDGSPKAATVGITASSVAGTVANILTGGSATQTAAATYAVTADFVPNDTVNYNSLLGLSAGNFIIEPGNTYANWLTANAPATGFTTDTDGDGIPNGVENVLGSNPNAFNQGLTELSSTANSVTFKHTLNSTVASDVTYSYRWSTDLTEWKADGETNTGGTTATIVASPPVLGVVTVTITITGGPSAKLFGELVATQ